MKYNTLQQFASGLACIMAGSDTIELDFSEMRSTKSIERALLSNYALEGQMHSKQKNQLLSLLNSPS